MLLSHVRVTPGVVGVVQSFGKSEKDTVTSVGVEIVSSMPTIPFVIDPTKFIFFVMEMNKDTIFVDIGTCLMLIDLLKRWNVVCYRQSNTNSPEDWPRH